MVPRPSVNSLISCTDSKRFKTNQGVDAGKHRELEERLVAAEEILAEDLPELLTLFADSTLTWSGNTRRLRSAALLFTYVASGSQSCGEEFVALGGLALLGEVLSEAVVSFENSIGLLRNGSLEEDTVMRATACLKCLQSLPLMQAPTEESVSFSLARLQVLRPGAASEALGSITDLSRRAREVSQQWECNKQPSATCVPRVTIPVATAPMRSKATQLIAQGLLDTKEGNAMAIKVEMALYSLHGSATHMYRQHARMLKSNLALPGNAELRSRIFSGALAVEKLVAMDSSALAPEALQEERRLEQEKAMRQTLIKVESVPKSDGISTPAKSDGERTPALS